MYDVYWTVTYQVTYSSVRLPVTLNAHVHQLVYVCWLYSRGDAWTQLCDLDLAR